MLPAALRAARKLEPWPPEVRVSGVPRKVELRPRPAARALARPRVEHKVALQLPAASA